MPAPTLLPLNLQAVPWLWGSARGKIYPCMILHISILSLPGAFSPNFCSLSSSGRCPGPVVIWVAFFCTLPSSARDLRGDPAIAISVCPRQRRATWSLAWATPCCSEMGGSPVGCHDLVGLLWLTPFRSGHLGPGGRCGAAPLRSQPVSPPTRLLPSCFASPPPVGTAWQNSRCH